MWKCYLPFTGEMPWVLEKARYLNGHKMRWCLTLCEVLGVQIILFQLYNKNLLILTGKENLKPYPLF